MNNEEEGWRPIEGWPYEVSSWGRVRRQIKGQNQITNLNNTFAGKILKTRIDRYGYYIVGLTRREGERVVQKVFFIHRLIYHAFNGPPPFINAQVRHLDGNNQNNSIVNLAWGTPMDNTIDRMRHGNTPKGEGHWSSKITQLQVNELRNRYKDTKEKRKMIGKKNVPSGWQIKEANKLNIAVSTVNRICQGMGYQ